MIEYNLTTCNTCNIMMKKLLFLFTLIALIGCSKDDVFQLTVINNVESLENFEITEVSLVGHNFKDLAIGIGESKTFTLNGIQGSADNTNITIGYWCGVRSWSISKAYDIKNNTTVTVSQIFSGGGCTASGIELN